MGLIQRLAAHAAAARRWLPAEQKAAQGTGTPQVVQWIGGEAARWGRRDYTGYATEGFMQNPVVYRGVRMIAEAVASCPIEAPPSQSSQSRPVSHELPAPAPDGGVELVSLLACPSPGVSRCDLVEAWVTSLYVAGEAFLHASVVDGLPREVCTLRPDRMTLLTDTDGSHSGYEYRVGSHRQHFPSADMIDGDGLAPVQHTRFGHPLSDHQGLSPLHAAAAAIDIHNSASAWNKALLDNSARPSGALVYSANFGSLSSDQYTRLKSELETTYQGARNAGRPMLLEGGLDWKSMGFSPRDMDFIEAKNAAARDISLAIGVPPMLLGIPGDNTYSNYQEANRTFWRQTVIPLAQRFVDTVSVWLGPAFGLGSVGLRVDLDALPVFANERAARWARLGEAEFLSINEKRAALGYGPVEHGDTVVALEGRALKGAQNAGS